MLIILSNSKCYGDKQNGQEGKKIIEKGLFKKVYLERNWPLSPDFNRVWE